jgi:glycosyltransferase involved in cell wall biosynthesis
MTLPTISIIMPSFNQSSYLEEAICSVLDQKYSALEFMILDGGSTDGSQGIIERYSDRLAYWYSQPDKGQTEALINGFEKATGDLLGWVNSDDVLLPGCLQSIARTYEAHSEGGLFGGNYVLIDPAGRVIRCKRHPSNPARFARYGLFAVNQPGSFFKRQDYQAVGGLHQELQYIMDTDLYVRMMLNGTQFFHTGTYLAGFRKHPSAKTVAQTRQAQVESHNGKRKYWPAVVTRTRTRIVGEFLYVACQVFNGNYINMMIASLFARGRNWRDWFGATQK